VHPILIDFGTHDLPILGSTHLFLPTYGVLFALSVVAAWVWFTRRARTLGVDDDELFNLTFYTLLGGILGAKLLLVLIEWRSYLRNPEQLLGTLRSAGVLAGGVILGAFTFLFFARRKGMPVFEMGDAIAAPLIFAQGIGRLGCFSAGCCWGVGTHADNPLAVEFTDPFSGAHTGVPLNTPLIATQLIQAIANLVLAGVLTWLWRRRLQPPGTVFWYYVLSYSLVRGIVEFWRGDVVRGVYFGGAVSTSQLVAIAGVVFATVMLARGRRRAAEV
jgi:phosphatidylglycerol:prolipoprotein diacylglycerol transferase